MLQCYLFVDINECRIGVTCINADCFNQNGSFFCGPCYPGFTRIEGENKAPCCKYENNYIMLILTHKLIF